jgi:predicted aspartyl protease
MAGPAFGGPSIQTPELAPGMLRAADVGQCDAKPLGQIAIATIENVPIVTVLANGHPLTLLLDTGAEKTTLSPAAAGRVDAQAPRVEFDPRMQGLAGTLATRDVELRSFTVGDVSIPWRRIVVAPVTLAEPFGIPLDGLLGADVLSNFDIDIDLPRQRMMLYEKRSCPNGPPWAGPYASFATGLSRGEHLFFNVRLDNREIFAIIDTGAQRSGLSAAVAAALGQPGAGVGDDRAITTRGAAGEHIPSHIHRFAKLEVGSEVIGNPELIVTNVSFRDADIILGADFVKLRRIWMAYESFQIFISPPAAALFK